MKIVTEPPVQINLKQKHTDRCTNCKTERWLTQLDLISDWFRVLDEGWLAQIGEWVHCLGDKFDPSAVGRDGVGVGGGRGRKMSMSMTVRTIGLFEIKKRPPLSYSVLNCHFPKNCIYMKISIFCRVTPETNEIFQSMTIKIIRFSIQLENRTGSKLQYVNVSSPET